MLEITPSFSLDESELDFAYVRASGPGGQNVNKVATSVQLRFDVRNSPSLEPDIKERLIKLAGSRMTEDGVLVIEARRFRSQEQNRTDAVHRLTVLLQKAFIRPTARRHTRPSASSQTARLDAKRRHGQVKRTRRESTKDWE